MLCASRAFWGLAVYRFGRWVYALRRGPLTLPLRLVYLALFEIGRLITKTSLNVGSRIESEVWIAPRGEVFISVGSRVGRGSMLHGCNTLGIGGRSRPVAIHSWASVCSWHRAHARWGRWRSRTAA